MRRKVTPSWEKSSQRPRRFVAIYVILVLLLAIAALLLAGGRPVLGLAVLGLATILNVRVMLVGSRQRDPLGR